MQHQDQLQSRRFSNEEIVVESLGCHVKWLGGGAGETHSSDLCSDLCKCSAEPKHDYQSQIYKEERVILALLTLMKPPGALSEWQTITRDWSGSQQEALQLQALMTLASITPLMLDNYMSCQGNTCLLLLLDWCVQQGERAKRPKENVTL